MKLWTGRFKKELDPRTNDFNRSLPFDQRMYREDILGSKAHAEMLCATGIITAEDCEKIVSGLDGILADIESGALQFDDVSEDIHTFVEAELTNRIGDAGKRLHTARSRNDQVALDLRLHLLSECDTVIGLLKNIIETLAYKADKYKDAVMPGYTHLQRAQPIVFGHQLLAYAEMFMRDIGRITDCRKRMNVSPLGSCALAGTTYPLDRELVAQKLGMSGVTRNSLDGVSDRDFAMELNGALSIIMVHLSRFAEEIILWSSCEFKFIELDDAFSTGSSIMPQKKNPDIAELVRGKAGRVFGDNMALLTTMKGIPLAYNKDMQEDKESVFDAVDTVEKCLTAFIPMLDTMRINAKSMRNAASGGFINATDCADYLVGKGLPFRDAYKATGELVAKCIELDTNLEDLPLEEYQKVCQLFDDDLYAAINLEKCVNDRTVYGGPAPEEVSKQADELINRLKEI